MKKVFILFCCILRLNAFGQNENSKINFISSTIINEDSLIISKSPNSLNLYNDSILVCDINVNNIIFLNVNTGKITKKKFLPTFITDKELETVLIKRFPKINIKIDSKTNLNLKKTQLINDTTLLCFFTKGTITMHFDTIFNNAAAYSVEFNLLYNKISNLFVYPFNIDESEYKKNSTLSRGTFKYNKEIYTNPNYFCDYEKSVVNVYTYNDSSTFIGQIDQIKNIPTCSKVYPLKENILFFNFDNKIYVQTRTEIYELKTRKKIISLHQQLNNLLNIRKTMLYKNYALINYTDTNNLFKKTKCDNLIIYDMKLKKIIENKRLNYNCSESIFKENYLFILRKDNENWYIEKYKFNL